MTLFEVARVTSRLSAIFLRGPDGRRPVYGGAEKFQDDPHWRDHLLFYEYFHGDNGAGLGASHQTGWTGLVARILYARPPSPKRESLPARPLAPWRMGWWSPTGTADGPRGPGPTLGANPVPRAGLPANPVLYQVNTRVWLTELSEELGRPAALDDIPDADLDAMVAAGFDLVYFLGVWQTGAAGRAVSRSNPEWQGVRPVLPDLTEDDICGSCFAVTGTPRSRRR